MDKRLHPPLSKKGDLGITKNYRDIIFTAIAVKVYSTLLLNHIQHEIKKNQNSLWRNWSTTSQILTISQIIRVCAKTLEATLLLVDFSKTFDSIYRGMIEQILLSIWSSQRNWYSYNNALQKHKSNGLLTW